jgi:hypothetical protein
MILAFSNHCYLSHSLDEFALTCPVRSPVPVIYYGSEQQFAGQTDVPLYKHIATINAARNALAKASTYTYSIREERKCESAFEKRHVRRVICEA